MELTVCQLMQADLTNANFEGANIKQCNFKGAKLVGAKFTGATGPLCLFVEANCGKATFAGAKLPQSISWTPISRLPTSPVRTSSNVF